MKLSDDVLKDIIASNEVRDQRELGSLLNDMGIELTQASLSRRLRKLNIHKVDGFYKVKAERYSIDDGKLVNVSICRPNLIIIRTAPGGASAVAYTLDNIIEDIDAFPEFLGMVGTVAGDDTIMVAVDGEDTLEGMADAIRSKFLP